VSWAVFAGDIVPIDEVRIPLDHPGFLFGYGVYEVIPVVAGSLRDWDEHYERIKRSAALLRFSLPPDHPGWHDRSRELILRNGLEHGRLKIHVLGGPDPMAYILTLPPWTVPDGALDRGVDCITFEGTRFLPEVKSTSLLVNYMAGEAAKRENAFEALLVNHRREVTEGSRTNLYLFRAHELVTANRDILMGITRESVIDSATKLGLQILFRQITLSELEAQAFDCLGISSSSIGLVPVRSVDGRAVPFETGHLRRVGAEMRKV
jgi:branched-subunit amino acid aminotransferase/4-amino-4-deoxychorismate lyase